MKLTEGFDLLVTAPEGVGRLRKLILSLAIQGRLVAQDPQDESAAVLFKKIQRKKEALAATGKLSRIQPLTKIAEADKPFSLPEGWVWARFGEVSINRDGERVPVSSAEREKREKIYDYYGASGVIDKIDGYLFDKTLLLIGEDGANLVNRSTPIAFLASGKYWVNNHAHVVDTTHDVLMQYLCLFINAISLEPYITGTAQPKMNQAKLNSIVVALPPLREQARIVAKVEELMCLCDELEARGRLETEQHARLTATLFEALATSESAHALAQNWSRVAANFDMLVDRPEAVDALEQTILELAVRGVLVPQNENDEPANELLQRIRKEKDRLVDEGKLKRERSLPIVTESDKPFELPNGWEWVRLGHVLKKLTDGTHHSPPNTASGGDYKYISAKNIKPWGIDLSNITYVSKDVHKEIYARCDPELGDVLYIKDGATTGVVTVNTLSEPFSMLSSVALLKPSCGLERDYLVKVMAAPFFYEEIRAGMTGVAITRVTLAKLAAALIPLPPLAEQLRIVARVKELLDLCKSLRLSLSKRVACQASLAAALVEETAETGSEEAPLELAA